MMPLSTLVPPGLACLLMILLMLGEDFGEQSTRLRALSRFEILDGAAAKRSVRASSPLVIIGQSTRLMPSSMVSTLFV